MLRNGKSRRKKITFLLPATATLPALAPFRLAKAEGYYKAAGLDVTFQVAKGGVAVATQVAVGNADLDGAIGDTTILIRPDGLHVKVDALLGGHALTQIMVRREANIRSFADLKGKVIGVLSYQESAYFNLLGVLSSEGLTPRDVSTEAVGAGGSGQLMVAGKLAAICAAADLGALVENAGVKVHYLSIDKAFPAMARAIVASDKTIAARPQMVAGLVAATLHAMRDIMADPDKAATAYVATVTQNAGKEKLVAKILKRYAQFVYPSQKTVPLGKFDPVRVAAVENFYLGHNIIRKAVAVHSVYDNAFVRLRDERAFE